MYIEFKDHQIAFGLDAMVVDIMINRFRRFELEFMFIEEPIDFEKYRPLPDGSLDQYPLVGVFVTWYMVSN